MDRAVAAVLSRSDPPMEGRAALGGEGGGPNGRGSDGGHGHAQVAPPPDGGQGSTLEADDEILLEQDPSDAPRRYTRMIGDLGRRNLWRQALEVFSHMPERDLIAYSAILAVAGKAGLWETSMALLEEIRAQGMKPNVVTYNGAIGAAKASGWSCAKRLLDDMLQHGVVPNGVTYAALMRVCEASEEWERALDLLHEMSGAGIQPPMNAYKSLLGAFKPGDQWEWALAVLDDMAEKSVQPDLDALHIACKVCEEGCRWREAVDLCERAQQVSSPSRRPWPPEAFYASVMRACEKCRKWEQILHLYGELTQINTRPVCTAALGACGLGGCWKQALWVLRRMHRATFTPDLESYNDALAACEPQAKWAQALCLLSELQVQGFRPSLESYNACMGACHGAHQWAWSLSLLHSMRSSGIQPDKTAYSVAANACAQGGGKWRTAIALLEQAADEGVFQDRVVGSVIRPSGRNRWDPARRLADNTHWLRLRYSRPGADL